MTTAAQVFFIILAGDVMIPCYYDITVGGDALDFVNLGNFTLFYALKYHVADCICQKVVQKKKNKQEHCKEFINTDTKGF